MFSPLMHNIYKNETGVALIQLLSLEWDLKKILTKESTDGYLSA